MVLALHAITNATAMKPKMYIFFLLKIIYLSVILKCKKKNVNVDFSFLEGVVRY